MSNTRIHLTTLASHESFTDCVLFCQKGLSALGYEVSYTPGGMLRDRLNILFCTQMLTWTAMKEINPRIIVYNWEPVSPAIGRFPPTYLRQMVNTHVWDYNTSNILHLKAAGVQDIHHVPMGYVEEMRRVKPVETQDIDVLFYGEVNPRRKNIIEAIRAKGLSVVTSEDTGPISGEERDTYIARAKVVLNIHLFDSAHVFEMARVGYLLANSKAVVTERSEYTQMEEDLLDAFSYGRAEELPDLCLELVNNPEHRHQLEQKGFDIFSQRKAQEILKPAIERYFTQSASGLHLIGNQPTVNTPLPKTLHINPCLRWNHTQCNIDARANFAPDLPIDITKPLSLDAPLHSWRFGRVENIKGYFTKIIAHHIFQQVSDLEQTLTNCLNLLEENGTLDLAIPLDLSYDAWANINDRRAFNEKTWARIIDDFWRYPGWEEYRFEIISTSIGFNDPSTGDFIAKNGGDWGLAIRTPRLIDFQNLILRKRALTDEEKQLLPQVRFMD